MSRLALSPVLALLACGGAREPAGKPGTPASSRPAPSRASQSQAEVAGRDFAQVDAAFETTVDVSSRNGIGNTVGTRWPGTLRSTLAIVQTIKCTQGPRDCVMQPAPGQTIAVSERDRPEPKLGKVTCEALAGWTTAQTSITSELPRLRACFAVETRPATATLAASIARAANTGLDIASAMQQEVGRLPIPRVPTAWEVVYDGCAIEHPQGERDCGMTPRGCPRATMHAVSTDTIVVREGKATYEDVLVPFKPEPWPVKLYRDAELPAGDASVKFEAAVLAAKAGNWSSAFANLSSVAEALRRGPDDVRHAFGRYVAEINVAQAAALSGSPQAATDALARAKEAKARIFEDVGAYPRVDSTANSLGIQVDLAARLATPWSTVGDPCAPPAASASGGSR